MRNAGKQLFHGIPLANISACEATIPFIKMMSQVNVAGNSKVIAHIMSSDAGLNIEENSVLTTDEGQVWIWGDAVVDGTWEQQHRQIANYNDIFVFRQDDGRSQGPSD